MRKDLLEQTIISEKTAGYGEFTCDARLLSNNVIADTHKGFYLDLISPAKGKQGERVVSTPLVWDDRVIFVTQIPDSDPCNYGGESWIMEIDTKSGGQTSFPVFDMNADGNFDDGDKMVPPGLTVPPEPPNGRKVPGGLAKTPAVVSGAGGANKYTSGSSGVLGVTKNKLSIGIGRQSWRQVR